MALAKVSNGCAFRFNQQIRECNGLLRLTSAPQGMYAGQKSHIDYGQFLLVSLGRLCKYLLQLNRELR